MPGIPPSLGLSCRCGRCHPLLGEVLSEPLLHRNIPTRGLRCESLSSTLLIALSQLDVLQKNTQPPSLARFLKVGNNWRSWHRDSDKVIIVKGLSETGNGPGSAGTATLEMVITSELGDSCHKSASLILTPPCRVSRCPQLSAMPETWERFCAVV